MPCWRAVRITVIVICWVRAPLWVRFPPQLLRFAIAGRSACSARQFVACTPGSVRNVNMCSCSV